MNRLYFAHPVNVFGTKLKTRLMPIIHHAFPDWEIEDPDQPHHQRGYKEWKQRGGSGMSYYYEVVLPRCHGCLAMPFLDGMMGSGVAGEARNILESNRPVWLLLCDQNILADCAIVPLWSLGDGEKRLLIKSSSLVLSTEETRARTWMSPETYQVKKRPYETAHLMNFFDPSKWTSDYLASLKK